MTIEEYNYYKDNWDSLTEEERKEYHYKVWDDKQECEDRQTYNWLQEKELEIYIYNELLEIIREKAADLKIDVNKIDIKIKDNKRAYNIYNYTQLSKHSGIDQGDIRQDPKWYLQMLEDIEKKIDENKKDQQKVKTKPIKILKNINFSEKVLSSNRMDISDIVIEDIDNKREKIKELQAREEDLKYSYINWLIQITNDIWTGGTLQDRIILFKHYIQGKNYEDIARELEHSTSYGKDTKEYTKETIKKIGAEAKKKLYRRIINKYDDLF